MSRKADEEKKPMSGIRRMLTLMAMQSQSRRARGTGPKIQCRERTGIARNASCPCGSHRKYKKCCGKSALGKVDGV